MINQYFVILGALFSVMGGLGYIRTTLSGQTRPHIVTYTLWGLVPMVAFVAELKSGVGPQALLTFMVGLMPLLVVLATFVSRQAIWKITTFDWLCGVMSLSGIVLWLITGQGILAIIFAIIADSVAAVPTIIKSYKHPETENWVIYLGGLGNSTITLLTISTWTFATYGFPLYIFVTCTVLIAIIKIRPQPNDRS